MSQHPAMPLFVDALAADTAHLSHEEFGLYMRLLMLLWNAPHQQIPNDDPWIARKLRASGPMVRDLINEFCICDGNWVTQKRLKKEAAFVEKQTEKRRAAANARWENERRASNADAGNGAVHMQSNAPTPTPTLSNDSDVAPKRRRGTAIDRGWKPGTAAAEFARSLGLDIDATVAEFVDYWIAVSGSKGVKLDWDATFRNRCRQIAERNPKRPQSPHGQALL